MTAWKPTEPGRLSSVFDLLDSLRESLQWVTDPDVLARGKELLLREGWCDDLEEMGARLMADEAACRSAIDTGTAAPREPDTWKIGDTVDTPAGRGVVYKMETRTDMFHEDEDGDRYVSNAASCKLVRRAEWPLPEGITACWQTYGWPERWGVYAWLGDNDGFLFTEKLGRDIPGLEGEAVWNLKSLIARRNIEDPPRDNDQDRGRCAEIAPLEARIKTLRDALTDRREHHIEARSACEARQSKHFAAHGHMSDRISEVWNVHNHEIGWIHRTLNK